MARILPAVPLLAFSPFAKPIVEVKLVSLHFRDHHGVINDYTTDWHNGGSGFPTPHWTYGKKSAPISHTMDVPVPIKIEVEVHPTNAEETELEITGAGKFANLEFSTNAKLKGGKHELALTARAGLEKKVQRLDGDIEWSAKDPKGKVFPMGSSWGHEIYVTIAKPVDVGGREAGFTLKRIRKAVELISTLAHPSRPGQPPPAPVDRLKAHDVVSALFEKFPGYTLVTDPSVPADLVHPTYFNTSRGGAWPISDFIAQSAECQALVRWVRAVIKQVGFPGTADTVVVWADPDIDGGNTPKEALLGSGGLNDKSKMVGGRQWFAYLCDRDPERVGALFDIDQITARYMGLNNFEACLRFDEGGVKKWYAGGTGGAVFTRFEDVINVFQALCWVSIQGTSPSRKCRIEQIVKKYH